jgi:hypothetical protein
MAPLNNIVVLIPTFQRFDLTVETIKRFQNQTLPPSRIIIIGSDEEDREISEMMDIDYIEVPNEPVRDKVQVGITYCHRFNPDGLLLCGSDDWLSLNWIEVLSKYLKSHDLIGAKFLYSINVFKKRNHQWLMVGRCSYDKNPFRAGEPIGPGRLISRRILDKLDWRLLEPHRGPEPMAIDWNIYQKILNAGGKIYVEDRDRVKILSPHGSWKTNGNWRYRAFLKKADYIIENPVEWLKDNFPGAIRALAEIDPENYKRFNEKN